MITIRKIVGWFLVIFAGLWALSGLLCAVYTLLGLTEVTGLGARLGYTAAFLVMTAMSLFVAWLGWKLRDVNPKRTPVAPAQVPVPEHKPAPKPKATAPAPKPAPVKRERTPLPTWVTGPGVCHDRFPYLGFGEWKAGLDECQDGAVCYVYNGDVPLREAIEALIKKERGSLKGIHVRLPSAGTLEYLDDSTYAQKWESADAVPVMDFGCNETLFSLCREHGIRVVTYDGPRSLFDHANNCHLRIHEEEGYGSVDDAATIGMWYAEGQPLWLDHPDRRQATETGNIGMGERNQRQVGSAEMEVTCTATDKVKYYYFPEGLLVLRGVGPTKSVDPGGHDGRTSYLPEALPWSDTVAEGTRRLIVCDGVTTVSSGLLNSLQNLEEIDLADNVERIDSNFCPKLTILRTGRRFHYCDLISRDLKELTLPSKLVHFGSTNSGMNLRSSDPAIERLIHDRVVGEHTELMHRLFREVPQVGGAMGRLGAMDAEEAAEDIRLMQWNSRYKDTQRIPQKELWELLGVSPKKLPKDKLELTIQWHYGVHTIVVLGALYLAAKQSGAKKLEVKADYHLTPEYRALVARWWRRELPDTTLTITQLKTGEELVNTAVE